MAELMDTSEAVQDYIDEDEVDPFDKYEEIEVSSTLASNLSANLDPDNPEPRVRRRGPLVACRSEALPFLRVNRPKRLVNPMPRNPETDCNARTFIPIELYQKVCKALEDGFNAGEDVLDNHSLHVFISYGFRALTGLEFGPNSRHPTEKSTVSPTCTGTDDEESETDEEESGPPKESARCAFCGNQECICKEFAKAFLQATRVIVAKDKSFNTMIDAGLYNIIKEKFSTRVFKECHQKYTFTHTGVLLRWLEALVPWLEIIAGQELTPTSSFREEMQLFLFDIFGRTIIGELFPIIVEFPDSHPILEDLKFCMRKVPLRNHLVNTLTSHLRRRLHTPAVNTSDLLDAYLAIVKTLKFIDPSGILAQLVTPQTREYLKGRDDTVRVILISLTDESGELSEELGKMRVSSGNDWLRWDRWVPDPIDVPKDISNLRRSDLIQTILSIYGSTTLFMDEYRALLADRLLAMPKPKPVSDEIRWIELLKLRFDENDLQKCEVMLKDVADSHRLNTRFYEEETEVLSKDDIPVCALVISSQFWPALKQESLILPKPAEDAIAKYTKGFETFKANRSLDWQKHIGHVEFDLEFNGAKFEFTVSPAHTTILWQFQEKDNWKLDELAIVTGLSENVVKSKISLWISKNVILQIDDNTYQVNQDFKSDDMPTASDVRHLEEDETESHMTSASAQREQELEVFWSYIKGVLANLDNLPLSRIFSMLKLFATVECNLEDLQQFLDQKVATGDLLFVGGNYKAVKAQQQIAALAI